MTENDPTPTGDDGTAIPVQPQGYYRDEATGLIYYITQFSERIDLATADAVQRLNALKESSDRYEAAWRIADSEITDYTDWRLERMWREAGAIADRAGHCSVYDDLVRELGGMPREREYVVTIPVNGYVTVVVTASSAEDAEELAQGIADVDDAENLELDWYNAGVEQN